MNLHRIQSAVPHIEVTNNRYTTSVWCPYRKVCTLNSIYSHWMCAHLVIHIVVLTFSKKICIKISKLTIKCIWICRLNSCSVIVLCYVSISCSFEFFLWEICSVEAFFAYLLHRNKSLALWSLDRYALAVRLIAGDNLSIAIIMIT